MICIDLGDYPGEPRDVLDQAGQALNLVECIAAMVWDGEKDESGDEFEMSIDDAFDTLHSIVMESRRIVRTKF